MRSDSPVYFSGSDPDATGIPYHEPRETWIPRQALPRDSGVARHWSKRRREAAYGRLSRIAVLAGTQH